MITLTKYINESSKKIVSDLMVVKLPNGQEPDEPLEKKDVLRTIKLKTNHKFFVVNDLYKRGIHLMALSDLRLMCRGAQYDSFEDFSAKDILFSSETCKECVDWMLDHIGNPDVKAKLKGMEDLDDYDDSWDEVEDLWDEKKAKKIGKWGFVCDSPMFIAQFLAGKVKDEYVIGDEDYLYMSNDELLKTLY
jgi:hypothetical protein